MTPRWPRRPDRRGPYPAIVGVALAATSMAPAQNALDANLSAGGRSNYARPAQGIGRDVYTINRNSGTYQYNRTNAFNDSTYSVHERYAFDRFATITPSGVSTGAAASTPSGQRYTPSSATPWNASGGSNGSGTGLSDFSPSSSSRRVAPAPRLDAYTNPSARSAGGAVAPLTANARLAASGIGGDWYTTPPEPSTAPASRPTGGHGLTGPPAGGTVSRPGYSVVSDDIWPWR